jgi:hypothetical protein
LGILISEQPMPRYVVEHMLVGLSEEEAFNLVLQASVPPPPSHLPSWAPAPAAPSFAPPVPNWPWTIPEFVDLTQVPSEGEAQASARV